MGWSSKILVVVRRGREAPTRETSLFIAKVLPSEIFRTPKSGCTPTRKTRILANDLLLLTKRPSPYSSRFTPEDKYEKRIQSYVSRIRVRSYDRPNPSEVFLGKCYTACYLGVMHAFCANLSPYPSRANVFAAEQVVDLNKDGLNCCS